MCVNIQAENVVKERLSM